MAKEWRYALSSADRAPISAPILLQGGIAENLEKAAKLGYQGLEVHTREDVPLNYKAILETSAKCGVKLASVVTGRLNTQGGVNLVDDRPYVTKAAVDGMLQYVEMAAALKTDMVVGWVKGRVPDGAHRPDYMDRLAHNLGTICAAAQKAGVKVLVEVINRYEVNIFTTAAELMDFIDHYKIDNLYAHLDTFHMNIEETDPAEAIRRCKGRLGYFHLADNTRCYPGSGTLDFKTCLDALEAVGYDGYLSVECFAKPDWETAATKALAYMKSIQ